ncbi:hypothetical protein [Ruegeria arenilitoris]|uniref:hypothetical protein n=1 Tax=Ruegeria arenilitoris TaxID=1173585 RepID=UPI00147A5EDB|nr:hypothetical protein [Ruegeria arenilitoris]
MTMRKGLAGIFTVPLALLATIMLSWAWPMNEMLFLVVGLLGAWSGTVTSDLLEQDSELMSAEVSELSKKAWSFVAGRIALGVTVPFLLIDPSSNPTAVKVFSAAYLAALFPMELLKLLKKLSSKTCNRRT